MTTQEKILQEIAEVPEEILTEILEFIRTIKNKNKTQSADREILQAYLASKSEREEVYHRLANS